MVRTSRWLALSRQTLKTVRCSWGIKSNAMEMDSQVRLLKLHASSIETLRVWIVGDRAAQDAVSDLLTRLSTSTSLHTLDLNGPRDGSSAALQLRGDEILFPILHNLLLNRLAVQWSWRTRHLRVLVLDRPGSEPTWDQLSAILLSSPNLKALCLRNTEPRNQEEFVSWSDTLNRPVLLDNLERLEVWNIPMESISILFAILHARALSELLVKSTSRLPDLVPVIALSASTLTHLRLGFVSSTDPELLRALQIPLLRLCILGLFGPSSFSPANDSMLEAIIHYRELRFLDLSGMDMKAEQFTRIVRCREEMGECQAIKEVVVHGSVGPGWDVKPGPFKQGAGVHAPNEVAGVERGGDGYIYLELYMVQVILAIFLLFYPFAPNCYDHDLSCQA
ncbi:hypothetical protein FRB95_009866 [Tulasnella sp. JGI-2019a]|nr:hypothetical protein FRB95_009866 [Tulasnella sp. JGI-2019a]